MKDKAAILLGNTGKLEDYWTTDITKDPYFDEFVTIAEFLRDGAEKVKGGLKHLNAEMIAQVGWWQRGNRTTLTAKLTAYFIARKEEYKTKDASAVHGGRYRGLLSKVLAKREEKHGLQGMKTRERPVPTLARFHSGGEFAKLWNAPTQFKDPGAQPTHGEFTHRIQWYLLYPDTPGSPFAGSKTFKAAEVFKAMARYPNERDGSTSLWDALFDRLQLSADPNFWVDPLNGRIGTDFRCPEYFNRWMCGYTGTEFPVLQHFLGARKAKRIKQRETSDTITAEDVKAVITTLKGDELFDQLKNCKFDLEYIAEHKYRKKFNQLSPGQKKEVGEIWDEGMMTRAKGV